MSETVDYEFADNGARVIAAVIDVVILGGLALIISLVFRDALNLLIGIIYFIYEWFFWVCNNGQTPGKAVMKIRIIKVDGTSMGNEDAFTRWFGYNICSLALGLGFLWALWDRYHQGWHDKLAETVVVKA